MATTSKRQEFDSTHRERRNWRAMRMRHRRFSGFTGVLGSEKIRVASRVFTSMNASVRPSQPTMSTSPLMPGRVELRASMISSEHWEVLTHDSALNAWKRVVENTGSERDSSTAWPESHKSERNQTCPATPLKMTTTRLGRAIGFADALIEGADSEVGLFFIDHQRRTQPQRVLSSAKNE